ncbi:hypothetical protein ACFL6X_08855 [Candidatus Latescibacterota bacterium]
MAKKRSKKGRGRSATLKYLPVFSVAMVVVALMGIAIQSGAIQHLVTGLFSAPRMADFEKAPPEAYDDLLYLTYLDSLRANGLASPDTAAANTAHLVMGLAGIGPAALAEWACTSADLNDLYAEARAAGRLIAPAKEGLLKLVKEGRLHRGYIVLAQLYPYTHDGNINFCGVLTGASRLAPGKTTILYHHEGEMVHSSLGELPRLAYFGSVVPGTDLVGVYRQYLRMRR